MYKNDSASHAFRRKHRVLLVFAVILSFSLVFQPSPLSAWDVEERFSRESNKIRETLRGGKVQAAAMALEKILRSTPERKFKSDVVHERLFEIGYDFMDLGCPEVALKSYGAGWEIMRNKDTRILGHHHYIHAPLRYGEALWAVGDYAEAEKMYEIALGELASVVESKERELSNEFLQGKVIIVSSSVVPSPITAAEFDVDRFLRAGLPEKTAYSAVTVLFVTAKLYLDTGRKPEAVATLEKSNTILYSLPPSPRRLDHEIDNEHLHASTLTDSRLLERKLTALSELCDKNFIWQKKRLVMFYQADFFRRQGRYREALDTFYLLSLIPGTQRVLSAKLLNGRGFILQKMKNYGDAESVYREALKEYLEIYGPDHPETAQVYNNIGKTLMLAGRYDESLAFYLDSLRIRESRLGDDHWKTAEIRQNLACLYRDRELYAEAEPLFDAAIRVYEEQELASERGAAWYAGRAELFHMTARDARASGDIDRAMEIASREVFRSYGSSDGSTSVQAAYTPYFETKMKWFLRRGDSCSIGDVFDAVERSRALGLIDLMRCNEIDPFAVNQNDFPETAAKKKELSGQYRDISVTISMHNKNLVAVPARRDLTEVQKRSEINDLKFRIGESQKKLRSVEHEARELIPWLREEADTVSLPDFQAELAAHRGAALLYFCGDEDIYVLVCDGSETIPHRLVLNESHAEILDVPVGPLTQDALRRILVGSRSEGVLSSFHHARPRWENFPAEKLHALWEILIPDPDFRAQLLDPSRFKNLLVIPDGLLARLPFEMLVVLPGPDEPEETEFLLDRGPAISYAPSATLFLRAARRTTGDAHPSSLLSVADPDYPPAIPASDTRTGSGSRFKPDRRGPLSLFTNLPPLPATAVETRAIADHYRRAGVATTALLKENATERNIRSNISGRRLVHFACHGLVDNTHGNSFGALAVTPGFSTASSDMPFSLDDDGFLTILEIFSLDFSKCELVVLSACDSNIGPTSRGTGTFSLARAFATAGARRIVSTNWKIADDASAELAAGFMNRYLDHEKRVSALLRPGAREHDPTALRKGLCAAALREAKTALRSDPDHPEWRHPYFWAPFVLNGAP